MSASWSDLGEFFGSLDWMILARHVSCSPGLRLSGAMRSLGAHELQDGIRSVRDGASPRAPPMGARGAFRPVPNGSPGSGQRQWLTVRAGPAGVPVNAGRSTTSLR